MIKIIKEGKIKTFTKTCQFCGCEFEYDERDCFKTYDYSHVLTTFPCQYGYKRYVTCPCCKEQVLHDQGADFGPEGASSSNGIVTITKTNHVSNGIQNKELFK